MHDRLIWAYQNDPLVRGCIDIAHANDEKELEMLQSLKKVMKMAKEMND